jgi:uncharacterized membrane protein YhaH (DUF805 family)
VPDLARQEVTSPMSLLSFYFSWKGRIGRMAYWLSSIPLLVILMGLFILGIRDLEADQEVEPVTAIIFAAFMLLAAYCGFAVQVKRWHDRDKSAVWLLMNFLPYVGSLWVLIECGFLRGTDGPNRFDLGPEERRDFERWAQEEVAARTVRQNVEKHLDSVGAYRPAPPPASAQRQPTGRVPSFGRRGL